MFSGGYRKRSEIFKIKTRFFKPLEKPIKKFTKNINKLFFKAVNFL